MSGMRSEPHIRFLCDQNLGKLAKWLRILGYDVEYMSHWDDKRVAQAIAGDQTVLTRKIMSDYREHMVFIRSDHVQEQIQELFRMLDIKEIGEPFTRCSLCNTLLEDVSKDSVKGLVPDYVENTNKYFARCPSCRRIYWKGTHLSKADDLIHQLHEEKR